ncbi:MAG: hypothetical protein HOV79_29565 [Hamadaea sp.]|nr:hypothetical protein [Hamadaea sp.]
MENTPLEEKATSPTAVDRPGEASRPWLGHGYRGWRRSRPYWGGKLAILAGVEIFVSTQTSLADMVVKVGVEGFQAYLIPLMLIVAGLLAWFTPAQRQFYGVITTFVAVYALVGVNLGGWFVGTLLGVAGGALIFAWTPEHSASVSDEEDGEDGDPDAEEADHTPRHAATYRLLDEADTGTPAQPRPAGPTPEVPHQRPESDVADGEPRRGDGFDRGRMLAVTLVPLLLAAVGVVAMRDVPSAYAAAAACGSTATTTRKPPVTTSPTVKPTGSAAQRPATSPSASPSASSGLLEQIIDGIEDFFDPDNWQPGGTAASPSASPTAKPTATGGASARPTATKTATKRPTTRKASPCASASPSVSPAKRLQAAAGQVDVAAKASRMTGSSATMLNLAFQGIVPMPTKDGTVDVLKFTMDQAVTQDFRLHTYARNSAGDEYTTRDVRFVTDKLTVKQNVVFYTSRFQAKLFGLLPVDYSASHPPDIPIPPLIPILFTEVDIQLVWVDSDVLTAEPQLVSEVV